MMNGSLIAESTDLANSNILVSLIDFPLFSNEERVDILFLTTLSRKPSQVERNRFLSYVESGGPTKDSQKALSDVLWALLNSTEFILNH